MSGEGAAAAAAPAAGAAAATGPAATMGITPAPAAAATPPAQAAPQDWTTGLPDDMKGYVQTKGFKDPAAVLESYRNFEKLQGVPQDRLLKLPESMDTPEGRAIWERLGAPKDAKEYKLDIPKEIGDEKLAEWAAGEFHKLGVPKGMAEGFVKAWNDRAMADMKTAQEQQQLQITNANNTLQKEWGSAFDQNKNIADAAARAIGMTPEEVKAFGQALGPEKAMKYLHKLGLATGEHAFVTGQSAGNGIMTPDQAKGRIKDLIADKAFGTKLNSGDAEAKRQWQTAHEMAYPGEISI